MEHLFETVKTSVELRHLGKSTSGVSREYTRGELFKIGHNAYIKTALWDSLSNTDRCLAGHVAFMKTNRGYVLSHVSAALWWGAPVLRLPHKIWVSHPHDSVKSRGRVQVSRNRQKECDSAVFHRGARVTSPLQTAIDCARTLPIIDALCIADYFLYCRLVDYEVLAQHLRELSGRGVCTAREVARLMSTKAESPLETVARYWILMWGLAPPAEQVPLWVGGRTLRPDFLWEKERVILEVDGKVKYAGAFGEAAEDVVQNERRRQHELESMGYTVVRALWEDIVVHPERLRAKLARAGICEGSRRRM